MPTKNSDLLKIISLKVEENSLNSLFWGIKSNRVADFYSSISAGPKFSLLLFNSIFRRFDVLLYSKVQGSPHCYLIVYSTD